MSKKTKKEKILADLRRKVAALENARSDSESLPRTDPLSHPSRERNVTNGTPVTFAFPKGVLKNDPVSSSGIVAPAPVLDYSRVFRDLRRVFKISFLVFLIQFVLYLGLERHGFNSLGKIIRLSQ